MKKLDDMGAYLPQLGHILDHNCGGIAIPTSIPARNAVCSGSDYMRRSWLKNGSQYCEKTVKFYTVAIAIIESVTGVDAVQGNAWLARQDMTRTLEAISTMARAKAAGAPRFR